MRSSEDKIWVIGYLDNTQVDTLASDLRRMRNIDLEAAVPRVRVLKKVYRSKKYWAEVPLLFNYGFFKMTWETSQNMDKLLKIKSSIQCLRGWLLKKEPLPKTSLVSTISEEDVRRLMALSDKFSIYDEDNINRLSPGMFIVLKNYPFEGLGAEVISIDKNEILVNILESCLGNISVNISNLAYSIYENYDEAVSPISLEDIRTSLPTLFNHG